MTQHFCYDCKIAQFPCIFADLLELTIPASPNHLRNSEDKGVYSW